ncbi:putative cyclase [Pluteus cervinus]|uniref:Cyclase n=1 Tax=Pluteus cervinus TaxID=181527 RepID=A0ACD3AP76_9AGAR|nr:putative cyclase [Pluteus cervinus]
MTESRIVDLTHQLRSGISIYPGDAAFTCRPHLTIQEHQCAVTSLTLGSHTGTHIDAPSHFILGGKSIDQIPLSSLIGDALIVHVDQKGNRGRISWDDIKMAVEENLGVRKILLIRTGWDKHWGTETYFEHPYLTKDAAERIVASGVRVLGVDTLSPDETPYNGVGGDLGFGVHEVLLGAEVLIVENLTNLQELSSLGEFVVNLVPLNIAGCDGSPIRAFAQQKRQGS